MLNNLFGGGFKPAVPIVPMTTNANMLGNAASATPQVPQCNVIYVDGMQEVLNYPKTSNEQLYFPEKNSNVIWVRETDNDAQIKNPIRRLTYTMDEVPFGPEANFVTKQEHQQLYDLVSSMSESVNKLIEELGGTK